MLLGSQVRARAVEGPGPMQLERSCEKDDPDLPGVGASPSASGLMQLLTL